MRTLRMTLLAATVVVTACTPQQIAAAITQHNADLACAKATEMSDIAHNAAAAAVVAADSASGDTRADADTAAGIAFRDAAIADAAAADACT